MVVVGLVVGSGTLGLRHGIMEIAAAGKLADNAGAAGDGYVESKVKKVGWVRQRRR